jgi:2,5-furandicarboxylate decarboxylase 1
MSFTSLRAWLTELESKGRLKHIQKKVDLRYELAALGKKADGKYALVFDNAGNGSMPVITGIAGSRELLAMAGPRRIRKRA